MVNKIWGFFILSGILFCFFSNNLQILNEEILGSTETALNMICQIFPVMALWLGIMKIAEVSGLLKKLSKSLSKVLKYIFPEIPENHESLSYIASNVICNLFGLGNAATPFGLKAMNSLQEMNQEKDTASKSMITFLVLNTTGLTIVPTTILSLRMMHKSINPTAIVFPCFLATLLSTMIGLIVNYLFSKRRRK
jgi:spore maturation protein A